MIHPARITRFDSHGSIEFTVAGHAYRAVHSIVAEEAGGLCAAGQECPLELLVESDCQVEYLSGPAECLDVIAKGKQGDRVVARGRISDYIAHDTIRLEGDLAVAVRLPEPQQATDYRRGSWLEAKGTLHAALPGADHDEKGLAGSIVG